MLVSEYIVSFFAKQGIDHVFGYPGGMVTYLMDALDKNPDVQAHLCYHEQGAALAACGYGLTKGVPGVAYATSGPGATNLLTGIANAYFDSIPTIFLTGQVNTYDMKMGKERQHGFQETDIVSMAISLNILHKIYYNLSEFSPIAILVAVTMPSSKQQHRIYISRQGKL